MSDDAKPGAPPGGATGGSGPEVLTEHALARFGRQILVPEIGPRGQQRLMSLRLEVELDVRRALAPSSRSNNLAELLDVASTYLLAGGVRPREDDAADAPGRAAWIGAYPSLPPVGATWALLAVASELEAPVLLAGSAPPCACLLAQLACQEPALEGAEALELGTLLAALLQRAALRQLTDTEGHVWQRRERLVPWVFARCARCVGVQAR